MPKTAHKVVVIGHRNPDTDSICSAIAYAELKNKTSSLVCEARRAGRMNQETEFVLKRFGVAPPRMCTDVNPKIRDVDYREMPGIPGSTSLRKAWEIMRDQKIDTLPITSADNELEGIITVKDIATANMDVFDTGVLATSRTTYKNILETLGGTMVVGNENAVCTTGHIKIGTATPEMLENNVEKGDIVILTNRYESQLCAIEKEASLLIICNGAKVGRTIQRIAEETGVAIMTAPCDTYAAGKIEPLEQGVDGLVREVKTRHIARLQAGVCTIEYGFVLDDLLTNYERIADHCSNIAVAMIEVAADKFDTHEYLNNVKHGGSVKFERRYEKYRGRYTFPPEAYSAPAENPAEN